MLLTDRPLLATVALWVAAGDRDRLHRSRRRHTARSSKMSIEIESKDVDVRKIMSEIRERIAEKKRGLYTEEEIREIAERKLEAVLEARQFNPDFLKDFKTKSEVWNYTFNPETIYKTSRGGVGGLLGTLRQPPEAHPEALLEPDPHDRRALAPVRPEPLLRSRCCTTSPSSSPA